MHQFTRRSFIAASAMLYANSILGNSPAKYKPQLSFSTLGCPDWPFEKIISFARQNGYKGIELRGLLRQLDITQSAPFKTIQSRRDTIQLLKDNGLAIVNLGSSCTLHFTEASERNKQLDEGKKFIDLAAAINCPYVRVFPNNFSNQVSKAAAIDTIAKGLQELAVYAANTPVKVLMETHGDAVWTADIEAILQAANHRHAGLVWDVCNMWSITKEPPLQAYNRLKKYIFHTHIKDARMAAGKLNYVFVGEGEVPILEAVDILANNHYKGYYSFEWEKWWHPEIEVPELAIADYSKAMQAHFNKK